MIYGYVRVSTRQTVENQRFEINHFCERKELTVEHIMPRCCGGEDIPDNVVMVCKSCNSSKGKKRLYEWRGLDAKDTRRIAEGKYLKYLK